MSIHKPTEDPVRLIGDTASTFNLTDCTITVWIRGTGAWDSVSNQIFDCLDSGVGGCLLRYVDPSGRSQGFYVDSDNVNQVWADGFGTYTLDAWYFIASRYDASGNTGIGKARFSVGGTVTPLVTAVEGQVPGTGTPNTPTLFTNQTPANEHVGDIADLRIYDRALTEDEIDIIYYSMGKDDIIEGLLTRLGLPEHSPGTAISGASTYPIDIGGTPQGWTNTGTGDALEYNETILSFSKRRR